VAGHLELEVASSVAAGGHNHAHFQVCRGVALPSRQLALCVEEGGGEGALAAGRASTPCARCVSCPALR
jgi:hypothetical protein